MHARSPHLASHRPPALPPPPAPAPHPSTTRFADLERSLGEAERARAVYELAIAQPVLDMPEVLWKVRWGRAAGAAMREAPA